MDQMDPSPHRRAHNRAARPAFEEARRAGLVQRRLRKLRYLGSRPQTVVHLPPPPAETPDRLPAA